MSRFILIACLAVLGKAGYASAASSPQATSAQTDLLGIRYEMKM